MPPGPVLKPPHSRVSLFYMRGWGWTTALSDLMFSGVCVLTLCSFMEMAARSGLGEEQGGASCLPVQCQSPTCEPSLQVRGSRVQGQIWEPKPEAFWESGSGGEGQ